MSEAQRNELAGPSGSVSPEQLEESNLHWVLCGGLHVGHHVQPMVWRIKPKDEPAREAQRAKDLQRLASAARLIHEMHAAMKQYEMDVDESAPSDHRALMERAARWLSPNDRGQA